MRGLHDVIHRRPGHLSDVRRRIDDILQKPPHSDTAPPKIALSCCTGGRGCAAMRTVKGCCCAEVPQ